MTAWGETTDAVVKRQKWGRHTDASKNFREDNSAYYSFKILPYEKRKWCP